MPLRIPHPSRQSFIIFLGVSLLLHLVVCKINVSSSIPEQKLNEQVIEISIMSIAAPSSVPQQKAVVEKQVEEKPVEKVVKQEEPKPVIKKEVVKSAPVIRKETAVSFAQPKSMQSEEIIPVQQMVEKVEQVIQQPVRQAQYKVEQDVPAKLTSNDNGNNASTVAPVLSEADYIQTTPPEYPRRAVDLEMQGVVMIKALIGLDGAARDVKIASSSGYDMLDDSALKAVSKWRFKPSALNGAYAETWVQVPVKFMIR